MTRRATNQKELVARTPSGIESLLPERLLSDESFSRLATANAIGVFSAVRGVLREANDGCLEILGRTRLELEAGQLSLELVAPARTEAARREGARYEVDYPRPDGKHIPVLVALASLDDESDVGLLLDLTSQRVAETALKRSEERFRVATEGFDAFVIFEAIRTDGVITDFRYAELNAHAAARVGRSTREELLGKRLTEVLPASHVRGFIERYARVVEAKRGFEEEMRLDVPGYKARWVAVHVVPLEGGVAVTSRDISGLRADEEQRRALLYFLDSIIENIPAAIFVKEAVTLRFQHLNRAGEEFLGLSRVNVLGKRNHDVAPKEVADSFEASDLEVISTGKPIGMEQRLETANGERWVHSKKIPLTNPAGTITHLLGVSVEITEIKKAEESLKGFEVLFRRSPLGIFISAPDGIVVDINDAATRFLGYARDEVVGRSSSAIRILDPDIRKSTFELLMKQGFVRDLVLKVRTKQGEFRDAMISIERIEVGRESRYITTFLDVTALKRAEESLREASLVDELTGLHNRRGLLALGEQLLRMARRPDGPQVTLLFIDLDGLKKVNDTLGHKAGDDLLREAALFLRATFRESDIMARLGGDEFVILAVCDENSSSKLSERLEEALLRRNAERGSRPALAMSTGLSAFPPGSTLEDVLAEADRRMYEVKRQRRA